MRLLNGWELLCARLPRCHQATSWIASRPGTGILHEHKTLARYGYGRGAPAHVIQVHRRVVSQAALVGAAAVVVLHAVRVIRLDLTAAVVARCLVT